LRLIAKDEDLDEIVAPLVRIRDRHHLAGVGITNGSRLRAS